MLKNFTHDLGAEWLQDIASAAAKDNYRTADRRISVAWVTILAAALQGHPDKMVFGANLLKYQQIYSVSVRQMPSLQPHQGCLITQLACLPPQTSL